MEHYVFSPPDVSAVPVSGGGLFPVRRIFCVGRNYAEHVREMGGDPCREEPFFFTKPSDTLVTKGGSTPYPPATSDLHHEMELVVAIGTGGTDIDEAHALDHVFGYAAGLDMTRRDLQAAARRPVARGTCPRASTIPHRSAISCRLPRSDIRPPA
jgi:fumarylpyruvate hydrolase